MKIVPLILSVFGCGKAELHELESAVLATIYDDPAFLETVCGFPIETSPQPRVQVLEAEGEAQPWFGVFGGKPMPATARIRLTKVVKSA